MFIVVFLRLSTTVESDNDQPSFVSKSQIHKDIRCVELDFVAANQNPDRYID